MAETNFINANGTLLAYRIDGPEQAPPLILSNSLGASIQMWSDQMGLLIPQFRVIRYDSRGHGQSPTPEGEYSIEHLARDVLGLLDGLNLDRVSFCGLSMGGMVGQWLGANAPDRLNRLVICNTAAYLAPDPWCARIDVVRRSGLDSIADAVVARWFTPAFHQANPDIVCEARCMLTATDPQGYIASCAAIRDMDLRASLSKVGVPTLVVGASHDQAISPNESASLAAGIPGARLQLLPGAHLSNIELGDVFTQAVRAFLQ